MARGPDTGPARGLIDDTILALLAARKAGATICPSEVARALAADGSAWRPWMGDVRAAAQALAHRHQITVTRGGVPVDALAPGGPIRLGLPGKT